MDGNQLLQQLNDTLQEAGASGWLDSFSSYNYLWQAAVEFATRTQCFKTSTTITLATNTTTYRLPADFLQLFTRTRDKRYFLKLNDGTSDNHFLFYKDHSEILYETNDTDIAVEYPDSFTVINDPVPLSVATGSATSVGAVSGGQCTLTDSTANFLLYAPGDSVENETDGSTGIVLTVTSATQLVCALFRGTNNDWSANDSYAIIPQGRTAILFDPPPSITGYTIEFPYIQRPAPVFSNYGAYNLQREYCLAVIFYACWLYKYRDSNPSMGDRYYVNFDNQVKRFEYGLSKRLNTGSRIGVNMKVRSR